MLQNHTTLTRTVPIFETELGTTLSYAYVQSVKSLSRSKPS